MGLIGIVITAGVVTAPGVLAWLVAVQRTVRGEGIERELMRSANLVAAGDIAVVAAFADGAIDDVELAELAQQRLDWQRRSSDLVANWSLQKQALSTERGIRDVVAELARGMSLEERRFALALVMRVARVSSAMVPVGEGSYRGAPRRPLVPIVAEALEMGPEVITDVARALEDGVTAEGG